ncbi:unnamed protein product [Allacma fusca]|uniref:F-box domain-containing protein n=1 Tax=Allacma fusca TaxID=39272 RepID=A0A8J2J2Z7_9HEXA|nr:unnamed protein product [Allacma fusca]
MSHIVLQIPHDGHIGKNTIDVHYDHDRPASGLSCRLESDDSLKLGCSSFLLLPSLVREKIYTYLYQSELLKLRSVCLKLLEEVDNFADFSVVMNNNNAVETANNVSIPFPYLKLLTIDNDEKDLPWKMTMKEVISYSSNHDPELEKTQGSVQAVHLGAISFPTFVHLSRYRSIKAATLTTSAFIRPIPSLHWVYLKSLRM